MTSAGSSEKGSSPEIPTIERGVLRSLSPLEQKIALGLERIGKVLIVGEAT